MLYRIIGDSSLNIDSSRHLQPKPVSDSIAITINEKEVDLSNVTSKLLYSEFKARKQTPPTAQKKS